MTGEPVRARSGSRRGCLGLLVVAVVLVALVVVVLAVVIGVLLILNADAVLSWLNGVLGQIQKLPFLGGGGGEGG